MSRSSRRPRWRLHAAGVIAAALALAFAWPGSPFAYVAVQARHQVELLSGRIPNDVAIRDGLVTGVAAERLREIAEIRAFGEREVGLASNDNYTTVNPTFTKVVWNVSASAPDRFEAREWWFPIVGRVPYLGFFAEADARRVAGELESEGLDVRVRTAGAYSTLGWFRDPVTPAMLEWPVGDLANTVLHELTHATLFVPGQVEWNESFANFVGDEAEARYLASRSRGLSPEDLQRSRESARDRRLLESFLDDVYHELQGVYESGAPRDRVLQEKARRISSATRRFAELPLASPRLRTYLERNPLNNASLLGWRRYHRGQEEFARLLDLVGGDLREFVSRMKELKVLLRRSDGDPFQLMGSLFPADTT
ncbi:aminopeptidase [Myxococcota bacterium]|nr:aminopeptidase [Myxococcota bacterium]